VYANGGASSSGYSTDYVELFNASKASVSLKGFSVQYASAAGTFASNTTFTPPAVLPETTLLPGQYFLVGLSGADAGAGTSVPADFNGISNLATAAGKVALARITTPLPCGAALHGCAAETVIDMVGYGTTASDHEGSAAAPSPGTTLSLFRKGQGCTDTNQNAADFITGTPKPRNTRSATVDCSTVPTDDGGTGGQPDASSNGDDSGTGTTFDSGTTPRNPGGNGAVADDSGCSCRTVGTSSSSSDKSLAFTMFGALGLLVSARRRRRA